MSSNLTSCTILQGGRAVMQQLHKLPDVGPTPTPATLYVACSSHGQSARLWPWRSPVRDRSRTPWVLSSVGRAADRRSARPRFDSWRAHHIWENARVWSIGAGCKSVAARLRWFKSNFSHQSTQFPKIEILSVLGNCFLSSRSPD